MKTICVFRCGSSGLYAYTEDRTGRILPKQILGPLKWTFDREISVSLDLGSPKYELRKATLAAIAKHGFYLVREKYKCK